MVGKRGLRLSLTDDVTGQSIQGVFHPFSKGGKFVKVWQDNGWEKRLIKLQGVSMRVLWHLVCVGTWNNGVPVPAEISLQMGITRPQASKAYGQLMATDFLYRKADGYYLNPLFCWKGTDARYEETLREYQTITSGTKRLPLAIGLPMLTKRPELQKKAVL